MGCETVCAPRVMESAAAKLVRSDSDNAVLRVACDFFTPGHLSICARHVTRAATSSGKRSWYIVLINAALSANAESGLSRQT